jgi:hypothetical protein
MSSFLLNTIYQNAWITIQEKPDCQFWQVTWLMHPRSDEFRAQITTQLKILAGKNITKFICDITRIHYLEIADQRYLVEEALPQYIMGEKAKIAYLVNNATYELLYLNRIAEKIKSHPQLQEFLQVEFFFYRLEAITWLDLSTSG